MTKFIVPACALVLGLTACAKRETYEWTPPPSTYVPPPQYEPWRRTSVPDPKPTATNKKTLSADLAERYDALVDDIHAESARAPDVTSWSIEWLEGMLARWTELGRVVELLKQTMIAEGIKVPEGFVWPDYEKVCSSIRHLIESKRDPGAGGTARDPAPRGPKVWA